MEQCWTIQEIRPIKVTVKENVLGTGVTVTVEPMLMTYQTFNRLRDNCPVGDHANEVQGSCYDYQNGECSFYAPTKQDLAVWKEKYKDIISW